VNQRAANLRRGATPGSGPVVPTQRERGRAVGVSERPVRHLDRVVKEAHPDLVDAVPAGTMSLKRADRCLAVRRASQIPTGTVRAREPDEPKAASNASADTSAMDVSPIADPPGTRESGDLLSDPVRSSGLPAGRMGPGGTAARRRIDPGHRRVEHRGGTASGRAQRRSGPDGPRARSGNRERRQLVEGARLLGLRLHDHLIVGNGTGKWVSLAQRGLL
jgi:hypothetical protein